ncbi:glycosyltransferase family 2 protein [Sulfitobacter pacificus]|uniref:glycosyltransferase family 2 protein n=1 Tax=Sulfitobacter pacificus TaxID=1499314 RepID=UPI003615002A
MLKSYVVAPDLPQTATQVDWVAGASVLMRASMLDEIGIFDETFFLYFEETDLCKRAAVAGWECWYLPQVGVVHIGSVSTGMKEWQRIPDYWFASRRHYFVKNHSRAYAAAALLAKLAGGQSTTCAARYLAQRRKIRPVSTATFCVSALACPCAVTSL